MTDNAKFKGLRWVSSISGVPTPKMIRGRVASGYTGTINGGSGNIDINIGDPVKLLSTGYFAHAAGNEAAGNNGDAIWGVCGGVMPYYDGTVMQVSSRLPANTVYSTNFERQSFIQIIPVMGNRFEADCDDATTATTEAAYLAFIGENVDHRLTTASEPKTNVMLDISTHATTTAQWRIVDISQNRANVDFSGAFVKLIVECNEAQVVPYTATGV